MIRVLYIASSGKSGSTLLGAILGQLPGFFNVGELPWFWSEVNRGQRRCGCGDYIRECSFWSGVISDLESDGVDIFKMANLVPRLSGTRNMPRLLTRRFHSRSAGDWQDYAAATERLYSAVQRRCGGKRIVDGSKLPGQLMLVRNLANADIRVLHLVRDGRAVAHSWGKRRQPGTTMKRTVFARLAHRSVYSDIVVWMVQNYMLDKLAQPLRYHAMLRYEDFATDPQHSLENALNELDVESCLDFLEPEEIEVQPTHGIAGSDRVRFAESPMRIMLDEQWRQKRKAATTWILSLLGLFGLRRFGYPIRPEHGS